MNKKFIKLIGVFLFTVSTYANADFIVNTGPGQPGQTGGYSLFNAGSSFQSLAAGFSVNQAVTVTSVEGWIGGGFQQYQSATLAIYTDSGNVPGSELFSAGFNVLTLENDWYGASGLSWNLNPGNYWVSFEVRPGDNLFGSLDANAQFPLTNYAFINESSNGWINQSLGFGVRIAADAVNVAEPETLALMGIALVGLLASRRRKV